MHFVACCGGDRVAGWEPTPASAAQHTLFDQSFLAHRYPVAKGEPMSHIVSVQTQIRDPRAVEAACTRLGLAAPVEGSAQLFSGEAKGLLVQLPGWLYPAVIDTRSGSVRYDNYHGRWGADAELHKFMQAYSVEKVRLESRAQGYTVSEQALEDGSIKLQIIES
jgi:hypothetical protein